MDDSNLTPEDMKGGEVRECVICGEPTPGLFMEEGDVCMVCYVARKTLDDHTIS